jgi:hypothetical protein
MSPCSPVACYVAEVPHLGTAVPQQYLFVLVFVLVLVQCDILPGLR